MAPVVETEQRIGYDEARELVLDCYRTFSPELGATVEEFFTGDHIDAPPLPGKRGGAFCSYAVPSAHPYVMLNYTSLPIDVLIMAHELGHGVHAALARPKGIFEFATRSPSPRRRRSSARRSCSSGCSSAPRTRPRGCRCSPSRSTAPSPRSFVRWR